MLVCVLGALLACYIFTAVYLIREEWFSPSNVSGRSLIFHFLSLRVADLTQRKCIEMIRKHTENSTLFLQTVLHFQKKYFEAILFSMEYKLWSHNTLKGFLHSYLY